jgi:hypothetical protein
VNLKNILLTIILSAVLLGLVATGEVTAEGTPPEIKVSVALTDSNQSDPRLIYLVDELIPIVITLKNEGTTDVITSKGFSRKPFHLLLTFIDPDGKTITADELSTSVYGDPDPPALIYVNDQPLQVEPVETLLGGENPWILETSIPNALSYYSLSKVGYYSVKAMIPMRTYVGVSHTIDGIQYALIDSANWSGDLQSSPEKFAIVADKDGDGYYYPEAYGAYTVADCDDNNLAVSPAASEIPGNGRDDDCNPATPDGSPVAMGTVMVLAETHTVGPGVSPEVKKQPLVDRPVRIFSKSTESCVMKYGVSWQHYGQVWANCIPQETGKTDATGKASLNVVPGDYIVLCQYDPDKTVANDEIFLGVSVDTVVAGQTVDKYLHLIVKADNKKVPAKYTQRTGSEIYIIEPEYVEWSETQELYPFIFESIGDWGVVISITPPDGFVADNNSLSAEVTTETEAVQFTVTDIGSKWINTKVEYKLKHKRKTEIIKSKIGIKCSAKLQKQKGFDEFCNAVKPVKRR